MADSLYGLLKPYLPVTESDDRPPSQDPSKYLSRILSLRLSDLASTEPESLQQSSNSNNVSIQALSSRSHRTTSTSFDHLTTLNESLGTLSTCITDIRNAVPQLDETAVSFASSYSRSKAANPILDARKQSMLLLRQADKLQDILELPTLLSTAIASANTSSSGGANYSQALDLFAHIKRLQILYPESELVKSAVAEAQSAMKEMIKNLITSLRGQNVRLAAAIRTIGWLRRVVPELSGKTISPGKANSAISFPAPAPTLQDEDEFGAIFLCARLCTFLNMTDALAPFRDLADQETSKRLSHTNDKAPEPTHRTSHTGYAIQGQQTERYLKKYIEIFREQSFATISMFRNIFPPPEGKDEDPLRLPSALSTFPLHLVEMLMETLQTYLPNTSDPAMRESLLMQVLYAANSLGRLGADFSMMIAFLPEVSEPTSTAQEPEEDKLSSAEPEWARVIEKHRVQAARLEALAAGQDQAMSDRKASSDIAVR